MLRPTALGRLPYSGPTYLIWSLWACVVASRLCPESVWRSTGSRGRILGIPLLIQVERFGQHVRVPMWWRPIGCTIGEEQLDLHGPVTIGFNRVLCQKAQKSRNKMTKGRARKQKARGKISGRALRCACFAKMHRMWGKSVAIKS